MFEPFEPEACMPDGSFSIDPSKYKYWSSSGFFEITLGSGNFTFTQAKVIDIAWDILIGRGGQALVALISWRVFAKYVTTSMQVTPVTFATYRSIFLSQESSLIAVTRMTRDFIFRHDLHSKIAAGFMITTMAFTLAFPTFASAMTGYNGNVMAFVNTTDNNYAPFSSFSFAMFVIHDGSRIGKEDQYIITTESISSEPVLDREDWPTLSCDYYGDGGPENCYMLTNVIEYVRQYGFHGVTMENSTFAAHLLGPPVLNISAFHLPREVLMLISRGRLLENKDKSLMRWAYGNETYTSTDLMERGKCQAMLDYQWGFSFVQLCIMLIILLLWTMGLTIMWIRSHYVMNRRSSEEVAGINKAVFELADAMRSQLDLYAKEKGDDLSLFPESELRRRITKDLRGGSIAYDTPLLLDGEDGKANFKAFVMRQKQILVAFIVCIALSGTSIVWLSPIVVILFPLPLEWAITIYMGTTRKSRIMLFFWSFVILSVIPQIIILCTVGLPSRWA
ncbi:hypothetical protein BDW02DRAFT_597817 [Decorospora gaudefroyi]|uniref:Uncharacterized protein n=1 Tax=Decorospora gaudefroyi TaxID=184978 RepID=A0A6A5KKB2_9PLEO|nr:hypothetical protein BDW02DRAFT_597817 [Decorospora gaudefroyi]